MSDVATLADRLRTARRRSFVGRDAELAAFRSALADGPGRPPFAVMFVHGPGGVGKSTLLRAMADLAEEAGRGAVLLCSRTIEATPAAVREAVGPAFADGAASPGVLLLDAYEWMAPVDSWMRNHFLPGLPAGTLVVLAGRKAPSSAWTADQGWRELLRTVPLRNLRPEEGAALLAAEGVPAPLHRRVLDSTHGHPLALALLIDVLSQRDGADLSDLSGIDLADTPDVVRLLLDRFLDEVPTPRHRRALEVCSHALLTTEELLRTAMDPSAGPADDAHELFEWLRRLSFVEESCDGLHPHDLAREVFDADLRWRDQGTHQRIHRRIRDRLLAQVRHASGRAQWKRITELAFVHRDSPALRGLFDWADLGAQYPDRLRADDRAAILAMTERHEGAESARLADHWITRQPEAFTIVRDADGAAVGYGARLRLDLATPQELAVDPGARAMWDFVSRHGGLAPDDEVAAVRFVMDRDAYQATSRSTNVVLTAFTQQRLARPGLAWDLLGAYHDGHEYERQFLHAGYRRAPAADFHAGGHRLVYARDFRPGGLEAWLEALVGTAPVGTARVGARQDGTALRDGPAPVASHAVTVALSREEFATAVRQAFRDLHRPEALARNPLRGCRVVREHGDPRPATAIADLLRTAADALRADPRGEKAHRAVDRTYLHPAPTQERAAELLGLPFSTYRRHLTAGLTRVADLLWHWDLNETR
ncbi:ATP-binding protein [Actinomadura fulvescens]|uniref:ATP-binding protein n=1 Tax=Actinomadura fulvescens TaxID=46160 RepID=A0ABN3QPW6_9ACTN